MKRITAVLLSLLLSLSVLCACSDKGDGSTRIFDYKDLSKYVKVGEYKGLPLSSDNEEFTKIIHQMQDDAMQNAGYGDEVEIASGKVEDGDTVHITYVGRMDGKEFSGGSSGDDGMDLTIGSGTFIDGFESGLIGAAVGSTVVLDLKFPDPYPNSPDLAGKPVEFTVEVQSITRTEYPELTDEIAIKLGYESLDVYNATVFVDAAKYYLFQTVVDNSEVLEVPAAELEMLVDVEVKSYIEYAQMNGVSFEDFLGYYNLTEEEFKSQLGDNIKTTVMPGFLTVYYIAEAEGLSVTDEELDKAYSSIAKENNTEESNIREQNPEGIIEYDLLYTKVRDMLFDSAKIENK